MSKTVYQCDDIRRDRTATDSVAATAALVAQLRAEVAALDSRIEASRKAERVRAFEDEAREQLARRNAALPQLRSVHQRLATDDASRGRMDEIREQHLRRLQKLNSAR